MHPVQETSLLIPSARAFPYTGVSQSPMVEREFLPDRLLSAKNAPEGSFTAAAYPSPPEARSVCGLRA